MIYKTLKSLTVLAEKLKQRRFSFSSDSSVNQRFDSRSGPEEENIKEIKIKRSDKLIRRLISK